MSTSGEYEGNPVLTSLIVSTFLKMGVINENESPTAGMFSDGKRTANALLKEWYATGIHVWTEEEAVLFLQQNQVRYLLGDDSADHCADAFSYAQTSLSSAAAASSSSFVVDSAAGFAEGNQFGLVLDSGAAFWTTITAVSSTTITTADQAPSSASAQNFVFSYADNIVRPLRIPAARRIQWVPPGSYPIETPLTDMMSRSDYMDLPNKQSPGVVNQAFYNPGRDQGELFVWPMPSNATMGLRFTWDRPIQTFLVGDNQPDLPVEWENALIWNMARELGPNYSVPEARYTLIVSTAKEKLDMIEGWDREFQSLRFGVADDQTRG